MKLMMTGLLFGSLVIGPRWWYFVTKTAFLLGTFSLPWSLATVRSNSIAAAGGVSALAASTLHLLGDPAS